jgi:hypothetical protein
MFDSEERAPELKAAISELNAGEKEESFLLLFEQLENIIRNMRQADSPIRKEILNEVMKAFLRINQI